MLNRTTNVQSCDATDRSSAPRVAARPRCHDCQLASRCLPAALAGRDLLRFEGSLQRCRTLAADEHLFRAGDPFRAIFAVQSGCLKTCTVDPEGREHVMAFHFPGEIIGIDAIDGDRHVTSCVALGEARACVMPYGTLLQLAREMPTLQAQLLRMLSRYTLGTATLTGDFTAEERLAAFLVMVAARAGRRDADVDLAMSRQDIASYLRLAPETVSRILARFEKNRLARADRRRIAILDPAGLGAIAVCMNPWYRA